MLEGVGNEALAGGFGHFPRSARPRRGRGNYALAAHRVTHGEPLRDMPSLRPGDKVLVETRDTVYTYEIDTDPIRRDLPGRLGGRRRSRRTPTRPGRTPPTTRV